jgi:hypothetical protein
MTFTPETIVVDGFPWDTRVATRFEVSASLPGGARYSNRGMQYVRLRWGRVVEDYLYEDTHVLRAALGKLAEAGIEEAVASPIGKPDPAVGG